LAATPQLGAVLKTMPIRQRVGGKALSLHAKSLSKQSRLIIQSRWLWCTAQSSVWTVDNARLLGAGTLKVMWLCGADISVFAHIGLL
jgi:hypothetical protein